MGEVHPEWAPLMHDHDLDADALAWLIEALGRLSQPMVVDVGCGAGLPLERLLIEAGAEVVGVDSSPVAVDLARQNVPEAIHVERDLFDLDGLHPVGVRFDAAVSAFAPAGLARADVERTLAAIRHILADGGRFLLVMPNGDSDQQAQAFMGQTITVTAFPRAQLERLLTAAGFHVVQVDEVPNADGHIDLYARCTAA